MTSTLRHAEQTDIVHRQRDARRVLKALARSHSDEPAVQDALTRLLRSDDILETFNDLAASDPELRCLVGGTEAFGGWHRGVGWVAPGCWVGGTVTGGTEAALPVISEGVHYVGDSLGRGGFSRRCLRSRAAL